MAHPTKRHDGKEIVIRNGGEFLIGKYEHEPRSSGFWFHYRGRDHRGDVVKLRGRFMRDEWEVVGS